ncbi:hypothetical protein Tco_0686485 [Tanacetum coccineum]
MKRLCLISVDDCIDLDDMLRELGLCGIDSMDKWKASRLQRRCVWIDMVGLPLGIMGSEVSKKLGGPVGKAACLRICFILAPNMNRWWSLRSLILWKGRNAEGPSLDESLENKEHLDVDSCDSDSPKNVNNDSVSPSSRVLREEDVRGVESDLVDSSKKASS